MKLGKVMSLIVGAQNVYIIDGKREIFNIKMLDLDIIAIEHGKSSNPTINIHLTEKNTQKQRYEYYKSNGFCCACGCENDTDGVYCKMCRATRKFNKKEIRNMRYEAGLCTNCGDKLHDDDVNEIGNKFKTCKKCRDYFYQKNKEMRERNKK